jgi:hypothetical protein
MKGRKFSSPFTDDLISSAALKKKPRQCDLKRRSDLSYSKRKLLHLSIFLAAEASLKDFF